MGKRIDSAVQGAKKFWEWIFVNYKPICTLGTFIVFFIVVIKKAYYVSASDDIPDISSNWVLLLTLLLGVHGAIEAYQKVRGGNNLKLNGNNGGDTDDTKENTQGGAKAYSKD